MSICFSEIVRLVEMAAVKGGSGDARGFWSEKFRLVISTEQSLCYEKARFDLLQHGVKLC